MLFRIFLFIVSLISTCVYGQRDVDFHLNAHLLLSKKIIKVKRDFYDPYLWVLTKNNEVYRVNSVTLKVDDYTAKFSTYNNLQFIDIAGRSQDTVFVATNSTNVIEYKNGRLRIIGAKDGIPGIINSVGISAGSIFNQQNTHLDLMIGTDKGFRYYNSKTETMFDLNDVADGKVYEATYRTEMFKDSSAQTSDFITADTIQYQPIVFKPADGTTYVSFLWEGGKQFGYNINTAVCIYDELYTVNGVFTDLFWGNSHGMFQNYSDYSYHSIYFPGVHYLDGIGVNKITSIYGLTAFGDAGTHQNLLVGTNNGFYFSSNIYTEGPVYMRNLSLYHDEELGNIVINDVCVNAASVNEPICEDGVWLAADDGLYLVKPDYAKYLNSKTAHTIGFQNQQDTVSTINICSGTSVSAMINPSRYVGNVIQWYKNGAEIPTQSTTTLVVNTAGDYYAVLYDPCEDIHLESNHLKVDVINGPVFSFNYPDKMQQCNNSTDTLRTDNNPGYHYRWYTNGSLNNDTTSAFIVTQSGKYKVEVSACTNSWLSSKEVEVDFITLPITEIIQDKSVYCSEDTGRLSVTIPIDANYTINWYRDGNILSADKNLTTIKETVAGRYNVIVNSNASSCIQTSVPLQLVFTSAPAFTFDYADEVQYCIGTPVSLEAVGSPGYQYRWYRDGLLTGDVTENLSIVQAGKYKIEVSACSGSWVSSKEVHVEFVSLPTPLIATDKAAYCTGDNATLSIAVTPNTSYTINWYKDNVLLPSNTNSSALTTDIPGHYTVSIVNNMVNADGTICSQTSVVQPLVFNPPPKVGIAKIVKTTICDGQSIDLLAHYNGGTLKWSTGETTDQISIISPGTYRVTVTSTAGCQADTSIAVTFLPNPLLGVNDTSVCVYKQEAITLAAPPGYAKYTWNNQDGTESYKVKLPQTISLTITDDNGCQTTQLIHVTDKCPAIWIPNTFTPNGDGINDTWVIEGVDNDATVLVRVYTRYGTKIFESKGYSIPWNGEYNGKKLPTGTYYYIVSKNNGAQKFSGSLTIIY